MFAVGAGLSVGKEGPFVHIASILADKLMLLPPFRHIGLNATRARAMLAAGVAAGVTATFGAPVGGVLFSIEVTASYYAVSGLWRAFICAVACIFTFEVRPGVSRR